MENKNFTPVLGYGSKKTIGHWDEFEKKFIALSEEIMLEAEKDFLNGNKIFPSFAVRITDSTIDGFYLSYRAIGVKPEDPRVIIYKAK
jgi:hypothetical protein